MSRGLCLHLLNALKLNLSFDMCRWLVEDADVEVVRPRGGSQTPPVFDQQAFAEAVRIVATAIAQASAAGS